ncbi:hypothetical protein B0H13DRAFT_2509453 [Mycena leptocephala]|nr:hypothetical protein B0H13DRAFT_2509453 [Mycena leptocephala]
MPLHGGKLEEIWPMRVLHYTDLEEFGREIVGENLDGAARKEQAKKEQQVRRRAQREERGYPVRLQGRGPKRAITATPRCCLRCENSASLRIESAASRARVAQKRARDEEVFQEASKRRNRTLPRIVNLEGVCSAALRTVQLTYPFIINTLFNKIKGKSAPALWRWGLSNSHALAATAYCTFTDSESDGE